MRCSVERDGAKVSYMPNLVHALCPRVLTGHNVPAQVDGDGVGAVHPAFLAEGFDGPLALNRGIELVATLPEAEGIWFLDQCFKDRPRQAVQFCGLKPPRPDGSRGLSIREFVLTPVK